MAATPVKPAAVVIPRAPSRGQRAAGAAVHYGLRALAATLRLHWNDRSGLFTAATRPGPAIFCLWHNRLALCMEAYVNYVRPRTGSAGLAALVSASRDGGFLAGVLARSGVQPVRGSSSRRGAQSLVELTSWAERGYDLAITPDGPRGPRYRVQPGVIGLAQVTGLPIVPFSYAVTWRVALKSWDRFQIPLPLARCEMRFAPALRVPRGADEATREALRRELETTLSGMGGD